MNNIIFKLILVTVNIIITAIGASLGLKAAVGVGAWDALSQSMSTVMNIKVGTFTMILNIICVVIQLILLKKEFKINHILQVFVSILIGIVVNFMYYTVFANLTINSYFASLLLFILSLLICSVGVAMITAINFISFPLEACCMVVAKKINKDFGTVRQFVDIVSIVLALATALIFKNNITVREGTIIAMIIYGPLLALLMKFIKPGLRKLDLVI